DTTSSTETLWPVRSNASTPARWRSHSMATPAAARMRTTASLTSGPMPSPGMSVMVCVNIGCWLAGCWLLAGIPREEHASECERHGGRHGPSPDAACRGHADDRRDNRHADREVVRRRSDELHHEQPAEHHRAADV